MLKMSCYSAAAALRAAVGRTHQDLRYYHRLGFAVAVAEPVAAAAAVVGAAQLETCPDSGLPTLGLVLCLVTAAETDRDCCCLVAVVVMLAAIVVAVLAGVAIAP